MDAGRELLGFLPLLRSLSRKIRLRPGSILARCDLVHDAYLALMLARPRFDPRKGTLRGFVIARGIDAMRDAVRNAEHSRSGRRKVAMEDEWLSEREREPRDRDLELDVHAAVARLAPLLRLLVVGHWLEGRTGREVAGACGMNENAFSFQLRMAKRRLVSMLRSGGASSRRRGARSAATNNVGLSSGLAHRALTSTALNRFRQRRQA